MHILPIVAVASNLVHFILALPVLLVFLIANGISPTGAVIALPALLVVQFCLTLGLAYVVATLHVTFRDTQHLLGVLLLLGFYLTPVFYDENVVPPDYRSLYSFNPLTQLLQAYRGIFLLGQLPDGAAFVSVGLTAVVALVLGAIVFVRASARFVEEL